MDRFPRGTLPPSAFAAVATIAPHAITRPVVVVAETIEITNRDECDLTTTCPNCTIPMQPEHAHYRCLQCGYRDSCCF